MVQGRVKILSEYFGQMPCIGCAGHYAGTGTWCNGGIPQLANKTAHVDAMEQDMKTAIPDEDFDGYIVDVLESETARDIASRLGEDRVLYVKSNSDPQIALSVAHELLHAHDGRGKALARVHDVSVSSVCVCVCVPERRDEHERHAALRAFHSWR